MLLARNGVTAVGCLRQIAIMVVFSLPLALVIGGGLEARLWGSYVARGIRARTIATVGVRLRHHFGRS